jgi:hypothetical protein
MALRLDTSWSISSWVPRTGIRADQRAAGDCKQQRKAARPHEGARDGVLHLGQAIGILRHQQEGTVG